MKCTHFSEHKEKHGLRNFKVIYKFYVLPNKQGKTINLKIMVSCFHCKPSDSETPTRLFACLHCIYFTCHEKHLKPHIVAEAHVLYVDLASGVIFCTACKETILDEDVNKIIHYYNSKYNVTNVIPYENERYVLNEHTGMISLHQENVVGILGMMNLGNSCFMNSVVQALLHTPLLRDYMFTGKHICYIKRKFDCMVCLFKDLFKYYYTTTNNKPIYLRTLHNFVCANDHNMLGNEQKDAHEFFLSVRNLLHQFSVSPTSSSPQLTCNCNICTIFHGELQSDVVCLSCSKMSSKIDPLWEISLDIPKQKSATLYGCLQHYTRPEPLGSSAKIACASCTTLQECTKQLTFKTLPLVIVIQLKRFAQTKLSQIKRHLLVEFPLELDMSPFLTGEHDKGASTSNIAQTLEIASSQEAEYYLYAVIVHKGTISGGHYFSYIRRDNDCWFKCNDSIVAPAEVKEVLSSEAYLLFYHTKKNLKNE